MTAMLNCFEEFVGLDYSLLDTQAPAEPARLISYITAAEEENSRRPAIIICPGGGYEMKAYKEGEPIALKFAAAGFQAFVLEYSVAPVRFPAALAELAKSVAHIREKADDYNIDSHRIFVMGFSAGGHLAASLGVFWKAPFIQRVLDYNNDEDMPNGLGLCYPVISSEREITHLGSIKALLGEDYDNETLESISLEKQISPLTPPTFIWHTFTDDCVDARNSLRFAEGLCANGIKAELHIYPAGGHGMALAEDARGEAAKCREWIDKAIGFFSDL